MIHEEQKVKVCDATGDKQSKKARLKKNKS